MSDNGPQQDDNVIRLPTREERNATHVPKTPPLINLPPVTKYLLGVMIAIHVVVTYALSPAQAELVFLMFGFIPARFTEPGAFTPLALLTPVTHLFLHGGWVHLGMNGAMLMAFGTGLERWIGARRMMMVFIFSGLAGAALQFALSPHSPIPVIGASGALSGFFAVAIIMMNRGRGLMGHPKYGLWPLIILWIAISVIFGMMGAPDGSAVAWGAHVGGFIGGLIAVRIMRL
jgi:membrane associated rhomboid family serine protease